MRKVDFISEIENKVDMISQWINLQPQGPVVYGKSQLADDYIARQLAHYNIVCHEFVVYDNVFDYHSQHTLEMLLQTQQIDAVYFASPSAWQRFYSIYQFYSFPLKFIALGITTQQAIAADGYLSELKNNLI